MINQNRAGRERRENNRKVAVVTGSSSGIGYATALRLARGGYTTFATMRNPGNATGLQSVAKNENLPLSIAQLDVTDPESTKEAIARINETAGRIDVVVNNAGLFTIGALEDQSIREIQDLFDTNLLGAIRVTHEVLPIMRSQRSGVIVNVSSMAGKVAFPGMSTYSATKFALEGLSESLYYEAEPFGIRIVLIEPGVVKTRMTENPARAKRSLGKESSYSEMMKVFESSFSSLLERSSSPDQVAAVILDAISSAEPNLRYAAGQDANFLLGKRKEMADEQFAGFLKNVMANPAPQPVTN